MPRPTTTAIEAYLAAMCAGQGHPSFCLPPEVQAIRVLLARGLLSAAQEEAVAWWAYDQGNAGQRTWAHSGKAPPIPFNVRAYWDGSMEFLRVSRQGAGWIPSLPDRVKYSRWRFVEGNPRLDGYSFLPPELDTLEHAWDRLLPGWRGSTVPVPPSAAPPARPA